MSYYTINNSSVFEFKKFLVKNISLDFVKLHNSSLEELCKRSKCYDFDYPRRNLYSLCYQMTLLLPKNDFVVWHESDEYHLYDYPRIDYDWVAQKILDDTDKDSVLEYAKILAIKYLKHDHDYCIG